MLTALLVMGVTVGCKKKSEEPVSLVSDQPPVFPEDQVPPPEPQPVGSPAISPLSPPVDTAATATPQPKESYAPPSATRTYVVRKGDTLQGISRKHYNDNGQGWRRIYEANRELLAKGPDHIAVGMKLIIP
jgi:nucleoid-associated protein YgaU